MSKYSTASVNAKVTSNIALMDGGFLDIYDGLPPATVDTPVTDQTRLARIGFGTPAFQAAVDGRAMSNALIADPDADASGQAAWYRTVQSDGTPMSQGSIGLIDSGADMELNRLDIVAGATVTIASFEWIEPKE